MISDTVHSVQGPAKHKNSKCGKLFSEVLFTKCKKTKYFNYYTARLYCSMENEK